MATILLLLSIGSVWAAPGSISGRVTDSNGQVVTTGYVELYERLSIGGTSPVWWPNGSAQINVDGVYSFGNVASGVYRVGTNEAGFFENATRIDQATDIVVTDGETLTGIDIVFFDTPPIDDQPGRPRTVMGSVRDVWGSGLSGVPVGIYEYSGDSWTEIAQVFTNGSGQYITPELAADTVRIRFGPEAVDDDELYVYETEYYNNVKEINLALDISVQDSSAVKHIDAVLDAIVLPRISGRVTDIFNKPPTDHNGNPLSLSVELHRQTSGSTGGGWNIHSYTSIEPDGRYSFFNLESGKYRVGVYDGSGRYIYQFYDDSATLAGAADVALNSINSVSNIDIKMRRYASISGVLTADAELPVMPVRVTLYKIDDTSCCGEWTLLQTQTTYSNRSYAFNQIPVGRYRVMFEGLSSGQNRTQTYYFGGATDFGLAADIVVEEGQFVTDINGHLAKSGTISGFITNDSGAPLGNIDVLAKVWAEPMDVEDLENHRWLHVQTAKSRGDGSYTLYGLNAGTYRLQFSDIDFYHYGAEYYDNVGTIESAADIVVAVSADVVGINAQLGRANTIQGRVLDTNGRAVSQIDVILMKRNGENEADTDITWLEVMWTITDENGLYLLGPKRDVHPGFLPGTYRICFNDPEGEHISTCYNGTSDIESAEIDEAMDIVIEMNETIHGVDVVLARFGKIGGRVTNAGDEPLRNVELIVYLYNEATGEWAMSPASAERPKTNGQGYYEIAHLFPGVYRLQLDAGESYRPAFWESGSALNEAAAINVAPGQVVSNVDVQMSTRSAIAGRLTDANRQPLHGLLVETFRLRDAATPGTALLPIPESGRVPDGNGWNIDAWEVAGSVYSGSDGTYVIYDLEPDTYRVRFGKDDPLYHVAFFGTDAFYISQATGIKIEAGTRVENINAELSTISLNVPPLARDDSIVVAEGAESAELDSFALSILTNDEDSEGATLTAQIVAPPLHGSLALSLDGTFVYAHDGSETLTDAFAYMASDGTNTSEVANVFINIRPRNDAPVAGADIISIAQGGTTTTLLSGEANLLSNDIDAEGESLTAILIAEPTFGTVTLYADGTFAYSHSGSSVETDSFTYKVSDGALDSEPVNVTILVDTPVGAEVPDTEVPDTEEPNTEVPNTEVTNTEEPDVEVPSTVDQPDRGTTEQAQDSPTDESADDMIIYLPLVR